MAEQDPKAKAINRLRRIEGQVRGLIGMLEAGKACQDVLVQYAAVHSALTKVGYVIVNDAMAECVIAGRGKQSQQEALQEALKVFLKYAEHLK